MKRESSEKQVGSWWKWLTFSKTYESLQVFPFTLLCLHRRTTSARLPGRLKTSRRTMHRGSEWWSSPRARMTLWQPLVSLFFFFLPLCLVLFLFLYFYKIKKAKAKKHLKLHSKSSQLWPLSDAFALTSSWEGRTQPLNRHCLANWGKPNAISKFLWSQPAKYWHQMWREKKEKRKRTLALHSVIFEEAQRNVGDAEKRNWFVKYF